MKHTRYLSTQPAQAIAWLQTFMSDVERKGYQPTPETPLPTGRLQFISSDNRAPFEVRSVHLDRPRPLDLGRPRLPFEPEVFVSELLYKLFAEQGDTKTHRLVPMGHEAIRFTFSPSARGGTKLEIECLEPAVASFVDELMEEVGADPGGTTGRPEESPMIGGRSGSLVLDTGLDYVVDWLTKAPSPIYESPPSFPLGRGRIDIRQGYVVRRQPGEVLVVMDGTYISEGNSDPSRNLAQSIPRVLEFRLTPLSPTRVELVATCPQPEVEPYLETLLTEMARRWSAPSFPASPPPSQDPSMRW